MAFQDPIVVINKHTTKIEIDQDKFIFNHQFHEALSYSIIYNLGLCYHLKALSEIRRSALYDTQQEVPIASKSSRHATSHLLQKAKTLYEKAHGFLIRQSDRMFNSYHDVAYHVLAILNNLGHVMASLSAKMVTEFPR